MISASLPRGVSAQWSSSPRLARSNSSPNLSVISLSTSGPPAIHRFPWRRSVSRSASTRSSGNQYERTSSASLVSPSTSGRSGGPPPPPSPLPSLSGAADSVLRTRGVQQYQGRDAQEPRYIRPSLGHLYPRPP